jgi:small-conductance mechanosensitive channel
LLTKVVVRILNPVVGYLLVLSGFVFLGLFVAALAMKSGYAVVLGVAVAASFGLAVAAFRNGSATLATAREAGIIGDNVSIWARPLLQGQIDGYHLNYRGGRRRARTDRSAHASPAESVKLAA